jgi:hypothetical protein
LAETQDIPRKISTFINGEVHFKTKKTKVLLTTKTTTTKEIFTDIGENPD